MLELKGIIFEDFINYKKPSMVLEFPYCSFKCGSEWCQNYLLSQIPPITVDNNTIIERYLSNPITEAIIMQGLEPFDSAENLFYFINDFRQQSDDDIVIYTGYEPDEILVYLLSLTHFKNIIIKFGRYIPNDESYFNELLGVTLASKNQYAKRIEDIDFSQFFLYNEEKGDK